MAEQNPQNQLMELLAICAAADGEITEDEVEHIREVVSKRGLAFPAETLRRLRQEGEFEEVVDDFCASVSLSPRVRRAMYREASVLCLVDGEFDPGEERLLARMRQEFQLTERFGELAFQWGEAFLEINRAGQLLVEFGEQAFEEE